MVASNKTNASLGTVDIPHEGDESYNNMWQKVRSIWAYVYDNCYNMYDWFHIGGDDLFLIVENLRHYLESEEIRTAANGGIYLPDDDHDDNGRQQEQQTPLFLGYRLWKPGNRSDIFNSGGSGYTLNKAALSSLVVDGFPNFF
jgi:glycoprotein-N-acetylgalactosamine 3-beta-galactosyltransferase